MTRQRIRRGVFHSIADLQAAINAYLAEHNASPKPFVWTKSAEAILAKLDRCTWLRERHAETQFFELDPCRGSSSTSARARRREGPRVCRLAAGGSWIRTSTSGEDGGGIVYRDRAQD
jgi:hypothetical protein